MPKYARNDNVLQRPWCARKGTKFGKKIDPAKSFDMSDGSTKMKSAKKKKIPRKTERKDKPFGVAEFIMMQPTLLEWHMTFEFSPNLNTKNKKSIVVAKRKVVS